jgi:hypothetical protein
MAVRIAAEPESIEAELFYLSSGSKINRRYVAPGAELNTGIYEPHRVVIRNGRPVQDGFSLDRHGFVLAHHTSGVTDFRDKTLVAARYPREVEELVRHLTGADRVVPLGWVLRSSGQTSAAVQPPASDVHVDMTQDRAERLARSLYERAQDAAPGREARSSVLGAAERRGYRRFIATSLWRAFSEPPQDWPLTVCDGRSVDPREGVPNLMVRVDELPDLHALPPEPPDADSLPAAYVFHYSPHHRWWYFPGMTRDEVVLLKFHDSDHSRAWRVPHTAFHDHSIPSARRRESIEFRTVAYFN